MKLRPTRVRLSPRAGWQPTQPPSERSTDMFYAVSAPTYLLLILLLPSLPEPLTEILQIKKIKCLHLFTLCICICAQAQVHTHIIAHMCGSRTTVCRIRTLHLDSGVKLRSSGMAVSALISWVTSPAHLYITQYHHQTLLPQKSCQTPLVIQTSYLYPLGMHLSKYKLL